MVVLMSCYLEIDRQKGRFRVACGFDIGIATISALAMFLRMI
jgi:hypothetical protein